MQDRNMLITPIIVCIFLYCICAGFSVSNYMLTALIVPIILGAITYTFNDINLPQYDIMGKINNSLCFFGTYSYELYISNEFVCKFTKVIAEMNTVYVVQIISYVAGSIVLGYMLVCLTEFRNLKIIHK